nr:eukaryotic translation initiation factor 2 alpha [Hymenolepis microstoma]
MSSKVPSPEKIGQNGDLVVNQTKKKITILGRDMSYKDLVNLVQSSLQSSTSMDIAIEVLDKNKSAKQSSSKGKAFDEIVEKPLPQGRMLGHIDNFNQFTWAGHGAFSIVLKSESDIYDERGFVNLNKIIRRYNLNSGEGTTDEDESEEEESEIPSSHSFHEFELALPDRRAQFTNEYLSKNPVSLIIQMELCSSNLKDWLTSCPEEFRDDKSLSLKVEYRKQVRWLFDQIVLGLAAIHENSIIHRDIKPVNIFIHGIGEGSDFFFGSGNCMAFGGNRCKSEACYHRLSVKIGDFGLSKVLDDSTSNTVEEKKPLVKSSKKDGEVLTANIGTIFYVAPEVISSTGDRWTKYNEKADIYALGVVLLQLLHYCNTEMEMVQITEEAKLPEYLYKFWPVEAKLLEKMLSKDPNSRPSALEIKAVLSATSEVINVDCFEVKELRDEVESLKEELDGQRREADRMRSRIVELERLAHKDYNTTLFYS